MPREIPRDLDNMQFKVKVSHLGFVIPVRIKNLPLEQIISNFVRADYS